MPKVTKQQFYQMYTNEMFPALQKYEKIRKSMFNKCILFEILILILGYIVTNIYWRYETSSLPNNNFSAFAGIIDIIYPFLIIIAITAFIWIPIGFHKKFKQGLKKRCMSIVKRCFGGLNWGSSDISEYVIRDSQLFGDFNRLSYDDQFTGKYDEVGFSVAETNMLYIVEGKHRMVFPVFKGVIISFSSNKNIKAHTIIASKSDNSIRNYNPAYLPIILMMLPGLFIGIKYCKELFKNPELLCTFIIIIVALIIFCVDSIRKWRKFKGVKLEDVSFDKRFKVYSQDQIESRYLLTTSFMNRLYNLSTAFGTDKVKCSFFNDRIMFAISTKKDLFELGAFHKPLTNAKKIEEFYREMNSIYEMIDYFKLNEKIGL